MINKFPELSIIVPVLNDAAELSGLFACLAEQQGVCFEVILCDGGSSDDIYSLIAEWKIRSNFALRMIETSRGRGIQMNSGADAAIGTTLLFLHADSRFTCHKSLLSALQTFRSYRNNESKPYAARFKLKFRRSDSCPSLAYFYHEAKARQNRGNCIRGDQGYLIDRSTFEQLGRYDCSLPFLEDVRLAALLAEKGDWILLPADITTSARRFEQEGFYERQVANLIIVNAFETGWNELLTSLPGLYRCDSASGRLSLFPLLNGVRCMINSHERKWQKSFWQATGSHVAANAWQLFFFLDVRRTFLSGQSPDELKPFWLNNYDQRLKTLFESSLAAHFAKFLTCIWFLWTLNRSGRDKSHNLV